VIDDNGRIFSICNGAYGILYFYFYSMHPGRHSSKYCQPQNFSVAFDVTLDYEDLVIEFMDLYVHCREKLILI